MTDHDGHDHDHSLAVLPGIDPTVSSDLGQVAFCMAHATGLTEVELERLEKEGGDAPCVYALRLDDLDTAGVALMPAGTAEEIKDLRERIKRTDGEYTKVLSGLTVLGDSLGLQAPPTSPIELLRACITEVRSRRK